jgi:hypothetical protein
MRQSKDNFLSRVMRVSSLVSVCGLLALVSGANASTQTQRSKANMVKAHAEEVQQPLYREYRGVSLGMTTAQARARLGVPALKGDDQDFYVFSENEAAQIAYDAGHKVVTISIDYTGGVGAPDYRTVVGAALEVEPDGSLYKLVRYEGYWASYNKSAGPVPIVTITLQLQLK